jgi:transglutaminase-like putative cysteine protease
MEKVGMILQTLFKRLFHIQGITLVLALMALACLPIALNKLVRDAGMSLLLPLTVFGMILAWMLRGLKVRKYLSGFVLLILGPMVLYARIGQMGNSLISFIKQLLNFILSLIHWPFNHPPFDLSGFLSSREEFLQKIFILSGRFSLWFTGFLRGVQIDDPVVRTLIWSVVLWLIAVWAGWQIYRSPRFMTGMLPSTAMLIFVLDYTGQDKTILWFHLALLLFLYGLTNYHVLLTRWKASHTDYSESTSIDTLMAVGLISLGLVLASSFAFTFSIKDFLDNFRDRRPVSNESLPGSLGLGAVKNNLIVTGIEDGLPRSFLLSAGPEISTQLVMNISTGDLPPMAPNAPHSMVPRYYWRTLTYAIYTGSGWSNPPLYGKDVSANQALLKISNQNYRVIHTQVIFPNAASERLYWAGSLVRADVPFQVAWIHKAEDDSLPAADMLTALATVKSYKAESVLLNIDTQDLRDSPSVYPDWIRKLFLALPDSVPERVLSLARDLTASEPNAYDRALVIQNYLRKLPYTLDISTPPAGRDVTDYFLFELKKGYCDYYATSMVVLARAAGLPARLVVGYANGSYDLEHAQYIVTENYAHSWVEIYFANIGWVEFEPTPNQPVILNEEKNDSTISIVETRPTGDFFKDKLPLFLQRISENVWFSVIGLFIFGLLWIGFDSLRLIQLDPSRTIQLLYKRLRRLSRPVAKYASRNQTALSYSHALGKSLSAIKTSPWLQNLLMPSHTEVDQLTELFSHSLFAPIPPTRAEANVAIKVWSRLRWRLLLANILKIKK